MSDWPDSFDFDTDTLCQHQFKPFIKAEMAKLRAFDDERPDDKTYIFHQHAARVAKDVKKTALHMGLSELIANNLYWALLPHDIGKRVLPLDIWDMEEKPDASVKHMRRGHTNKGVEIVEEEFTGVTHPFKDLMVDIMMNHHEHMDGNGTHGLSGDQLSPPVRLSAIVEAYDGYRIWRPHFGDRDISAPAVIKRMRDEKGADMFDMKLFEAFADMKMIEYNNMNKQQNEEG